MSSIIFDRLINYNHTEQICETDEEVEEEHYNFNNADVSSKNYLVNLYKVVTIFLNFFPTNFNRFCFQIRI